GFFVLYKEGSETFRTLNPALLGLRLIQELDQLAFRTRDDMAFLEASIIEREGVRALVPTEIVPYMRLAGRHVERELTLPLEINLAVDLDTGRLHPAPRHLDIPAEAFNDLAKRLDVPKATVPKAEADSGKPLNFVCAFHWDPDYPDILPLTRAMAVQAVAPDILNLEKVGGRALAPLAQAVEGARCYLIQNPSVDKTFELIRGVSEAEVAD